MTLTGNNAAGCERLSLNFSSSFLPARKIACTSNLPLNQLAENLRNIAATFPTGVDEHRKLFRIQTERTSRRPGRFFARIGKLGMNRHSRDLDPLRRNSVVDQLLSALPQLATR